MQELIYMRYMGKRDVWKNCYHSTYGCDAALRHGERTYYHCGKAYSVDNNRKMNPDRGVCRDWPKCKGGRTLLCINQRKLVKLVASWTRSWSWSLTVAAHRLRAMGLTWGALVMPDSAHDLLTTADVCRELGISPHDVHRLEAEGYLEHKVMDRNKHGETPLFSDQDVSSVRLKLPRILKNWNDSYSGF